jgi:hypothetical protein
VSVRVNRRMVDSEAGFVLNRHIVMMTHPTNGYPRFRPIVCIADVSIPSPSRTATYSSQYRRTMRILVIGRSQAGSEQAK